MATKIQVRRDTAANWTANNPVLSSGEIGFVTDENKMKLGNGSTAWNSLSYLQGAESGVTSLVGTANEVEVSASSGAVTISLPSTINANTTGTAASLTTARTIALSGDISGSASFDGSASVNITTAIQPNSVVLGTDTTGDYVATISGTTNQITVSASSGNSTLSFPAAVTFPGTVTLNGNPLNALEAATKQYVDAIAEGLHIHASVSTATSASIDLSSPSASVDGVALTNNMRVLVKNQSNTAQNGIYVYNSASAILVRASDFDTVAEIQGGDFVFVTGGNTYADTGWVQTETVTTLGTDPILFTQFSGAGTYTAGTGLFLDGTVFSNTGVLSISGTTDEVEVSASTGNITIGLPSSVALGTVTSGTWNGSVIGLTYGGTNANLTAVNGGVVYSTGSAMAISSAGEVGQVLTSNGAGAPTWAAAASGGSAIGEPFFLAGL